MTLLFTESITTVRCALCNRINDWDNWIKPSFYTYSVVRSWNLYGIAKSCPSCPVKGSDHSLLFILVTLAKESLANYSKEFIAMYDSDMLLRASINKIWCRDASSRCNSICWNRRLHRKTAKFISSVYCLKSSSQ
jgi:hypothetical protein